MTDSIEYLQASEQESSHCIQLLNEADQALQAMVLSIQNWSSAHHENLPTGHRIADAIQNIRHVLSEANEHHNTIVAMLAEARQEAEARPADGGT